jgi:hypothetical protein
MPKAKIIKIERKWKKNVDSIVPEAPEKVDSDVTTPRTPAVSHPCW